MHTLRRSLLLAALLSACGLAAAQAPAFPAKPVHIVLGFTAGGVIDGFARDLVPRLSAAWGQPVIVDNKPGANGILAMSFVAKAPADGYTLLLGAAGNISLNEFFYATLPYQLERDFTPVTQLTSASLALMVNPSLPVRDVAGLVAYAKANPGRVNYASTGNGSSPHLAAEMFKALAGVQMTHVPYKGSGQAITDLLGGQVQLMFDAPVIGLPQVQAGKLRMLALTGSRRMASLPDLPTVAEALPGYEAANWFGMLAPAGTPPEVVRRIRDDIARAMQAPEMRDKMVAGGIEPVGSTPEEFGRFIRQEQQRWGDVIRKAGIRMQ